MTSSEIFKQRPVEVRRGIPIFVDKGPADISADRYERYWEVVVRQLLLHYADELGRENGFQPVYDFIFRAFVPSFQGRILEVAGGVGRLAGELARRFPESDIFLVDYSYNMLRSAHDRWVAGKDIHLDGRHLGWQETVLKGDRLSNLWLGQVRGEDLPFRQETMDVVFSTFFLDRAADLAETVREQTRVLRTGGKLIVVSPLNFQSRREWEQYGDPEKLTAFFRQFGLDLIEFKDNLFAVEPLDARGNAIHWRAAGWVFEKKVLPIVAR